MIEANREGPDETIAKRQNRIKFAKEVLKNDLLPHVSVKSGDEFKKAFFCGLHGQQTYPSIFRSST